MRVGADWLPGDGGTFVPDCVWLVVAPVTRASPPLCGANQLGDTSYHLQKPPKKALKDALARLVPYSPSQDSALLRYRFIGVGLAGMASHLLIGLAG